jgi:hypothetical protein
MCFAKLYAELCFQFTIGHISLSCLYNFTVACICGALGFMLTHFHLFSASIVLLHLFRMLHISCCFVFVMSCDNLTKLFLAINSPMSWCNITSVLALSAFVMTSLFLIAFCFMILIVLRSRCSCLERIVWRFSFWVLCIL